MCRDGLWNEKVMRFVVGYKMSMTYFLIEGFAGTR